MTRRSILYASSLSVILLLAFLPLVSALGAGLVAQYAGCRLDEGGVYPCVIHGVDVGETLSIMFVLGWLSMISLPFGAAALVVWAGVLVVDLISRWVAIRQAARSRP